MGPIDWIEWWVEFIDGIKDDQRMHMWNHRQSLSGIFNNPKKEYDYMSEDFCIFGTIQWVLNMNMGCDERIRNSKSPTQRRYVSPFAVYDGSLERAIGFWSGNLKESTAVGRMRPDGFLHSEWTKKWVKQCHKPFMTGNGLYHLFMVIWGMVSYCFTHIIEDAKRERERGESGRQCDIWKWFLHSGFTGVIPDTILTIPQKSEA